MKCRTFPNESTFIRLEGKLERIEFLHKLKNRETSHLVMTFRTFVFFAGFFSFFDKNGRIVFFCDYWKTDVKFVTE